MKRCVDMYVTLFSLTKEKRQRPKYAQLKNDPFIKKYEKAEVDVGEWFENAVRQADAVAQAAARYVAWLVSVFLSFSLPICTQM